MWLETLYRKISQRTGYDLDEVIRLMRIFWGGNGFRKQLRIGEDVWIRGLLRTYRTQSQLDKMAEKEAARERKRKRKSRIKQRNYRKRQRKKKRLQNKK